MRSTGPCLSLALAFLLALLLALPPVVARAEERHDGAFWLVSQLHVPLGERLSFNVMVQNRVTQDLDAYERTVVRPWLGVALPGRLDLSLGYDAHIFENPREFLENRAWQRIGYFHELGRVRAFTHFWLEQRFFEGASDVALRGRFQLGARLPLPSELALVARNEFFLNLNKTDVIRDTGLGENHLFVGVNRPFGRHLRLEVGYLMQYLDPPGIDILNHTLVLGVALTTPRAFDLF